MTHINERPTKRELEAYAKVERYYAGTVIDNALAQDPDAPDLLQGQFEYAIGLLVDRQGEIAAEDPAFADLVSYCIDRAAAYCGPGRGK